MRGLQLKLFAAGVVLLLVPAFAPAHFILVTPPSSLQTENGGKGAPPCGEGIDSNVITQVQGGHPLPIRITEFIFHPGHYRFALSVNSRAELPPDPDVVESDGISVSAPIQNPARIPVLADGVFAHTDPPTADWQTNLTLPNLSCEKCTLQVIEFMAEHGANPGGGFYYHHCSDLKIVADPTLPPADPAWPRASAAGNPATAVFSHFADGGGWQTAITLLNLDLVPAAFTLKFWGDDGSPLAPSLAGSDPLSALSGTIAVGGSQTVETTGSPPAVSTGWAQISSSQAIGGTAIFRSTTTGQEAAVRLLSSGGSRLLFPFDNNNGLATGIALAAPGASASGSFTLRNQQGQTISVEPPESVPANGHAAFVLPVRSTQPQDLRGAAEFNSNVPAFGLGIRANQGSFTSVEAVAPEPPSTKTISHIADGGSWKTTIVLLNTDTGPASFTLNCWKDDGTPFPVLPGGSSPQATITGVIPAGGTQTIETSGAGADVATGWAEVLSDQSVGGTAIFRLQSSGQEAAVPLLSGGGRKVVLPFASGPGLALGIALANTDPVRDATVTVAVRDEQGNAIAFPPAFLLGHHQHTSFVLDVPAGGTSVQRGVVEFDSPTVDIFALGIRSNNGAFTSIRALNK
jgi:hypothetical protein